MKQLILMIFKTYVFPLIIEMIKRLLYDVKETRKSESDLIKDFESLMAKKGKRKGFVDKQFLSKEEFRLYLKFSTLKEVNKTRFLRLAIYIICISITIITSIAFYYLYFNAI